MTSFWYNFAGGLSATCAVKISLTDVNDNRPVFLPREYRVNVGGDDDVSASSAIAVIRATDADGGHFGELAYRVTGGNDDNVFRIDRTSGELFVLRTKSLSANRQYTLNVSATDGGGLKSAEEARVHITVIGAGAGVLRFERPRYIFNVSENAPLNTPLGSVKINAIFNGE